MFSGTEKRIFDCRRCKRKDDKRCAIWGLKPGVDVWNRIRGDLFTSSSENLKYFSIPLAEEVHDKGSAEGTTTIIKSELLSGNGTPRSSLWSAENWSPETGRRRFSPEIINVPYKKNSPLKSTEESTTGDAKARAEKGRRDSYKGNPRESALHSLAHRSRSPGPRWEESLPESHEEDRTRTRSSGRREDPILPSRAGTRSRSDGREGESGFPSRADSRRSRSRSDGRRASSEFSSRGDKRRSGEDDSSPQVFRRRECGAPEEEANSSPWQANRSGSRGRGKGSENLREGGRGRGEGRQEDSLGRDRQFDRNLQPGRNGSVGRNRKYGSQSPVDGGRYRKLDALMQGERNSAEKNFQAERYRSPIMGKSGVAPSRSETSTRVSIQRGRRSVSGTNRKRESSAESYNSDRERRQFSRRSTERGSSEGSYREKFDSGHKSVSQRKRKTPSVESYGGKSDGSVRRGEEISEERISGTIPDSPASDSKSEEAYDWNSSYQGSDCPDVEGLENLQSKMTPAQFRKFTMGCLETRPRRGKKQEDCRVCEGHEHRNKEIMENAERVGRAEWNKKLLNRIDGLGSQRNRFPWSVHDEKIKESLKRIATPRRVYEQQDGRWPRGYSEEEVEELDLEESPRFQYLDRNEQEEKKQDRAPPSIREKYSGETLSKPEGLGRRNGGNDPVTQIVIPDPRKVWKRRDEKSGHMRFNSPDRLQRKPRWNDSGMAANQKLLKREKQSDRQKEIPADHGVFGNQESLRKRFLDNLGKEKKVPTDHGVLANQESLKKQLLVNLEKGMYRVSSLESMETPEARYADGMLNNQGALKQHFVSELNESSETPQSRKKIPHRADTQERRTPYRDVNTSRLISAARKRDPTPVDTKRILESREAKGAAFPSGEHHPTPKETIDDSRRAMSSRRPSPWVGRPTRPHWEQEEHSSTMEEDQRKGASKQEEEPEKGPIPSPVMTTRRREARPASAPRGKTPTRRYCPSAPRSSVHSPPCPRFIIKGEASKKMLLDQEEPHIPKISRDLLSTSSRLRQQTMSPCQRFVGHEERSSSFLQKKHQDEFKLEPDAKEWCSPKDRHVQSVMRRARNTNSTPSCQRFVNHDEKSTAYLQRKRQQEYKLEQDGRESRSPTDLHVQSAQKRAQYLRSPPPCDRYKKREEEGRIPPERPLPRTAPAKLRHANAPMRQEESASCGTSTRHHAESRKILERSESSRESTPGSRGFWDWKEEEKARESLREVERQREDGRPCSRWQKLEERSRTVLEQARIKLEEDLKQWGSDCPVPYDRCQKCQDKRKEVESLSRWRAQDSNFSTRHKRS